MDFSSSTTFFNKRWNMKKDEYEKCCKCEEKRRIAKDALKWELEKKEEESKEEVAA
mgnify:CR=1 FL=1|tara:strand:- start:263 stop:430 length:168 start_codon:yes stop_codon:yes gene_type:complete